MIEFSLDAFFILKAPSLLYQFLILSLKICFETKYGLFLPAKPVEVATQ